MDLNEPQNLICYWYFLPSLSLSLLLSQAGYTRTPNKLPSRKQTDPSTRTSADTKTDLMRSSNIRETKESATLTIWWKLFLFIIIFVSFCYCFIYRAICFVCIHSLHHIFAVSLLWATLLYLSRMRFRVATPLCTLVYCMRVLTVIVILTSSHTLCFPMQSLSLLFSPVDYNGYAVYVGEDEWLYCLLVHSANSCRDHFVHQCCFIGSFSLQKPKASLTESLFEVLFKNIKALIVLVFHSRT
jgi:hypothetical protein